MALTDLTFQLGSGPILNSDASSPFLDVTRVRGLDSAPFRSTERDHEGVDGSFMDAEFEKGRNVIIEGTVYATTSTIEGYLDQLKANYAPSRTLLSFVWKTPDLTERLLFVKPLGIAYDWEAARRIGCVDVQISMFAEIPIIYDNNLISTNLSIGAFVFTGFAFNLGFDFGFGGATTLSDGVFVNNSGNRATPPTFTINGPVLNPQIISDTADKNMSFNIDLLTGETLVVDAYYRTVKLNGITNRRNTLLSPNWFYLSPGDNFLRFRGESGSGTLNVAFRPAWR